jgi:hypothetical protein
VPFPLGHVLKSRPSQNKYHLALPCGAGVGELLRGTPKGTFTFYSIPNGMLKKYVYSLNVNKVLTIHYENIFQYILICFYNISKIYHYFISKNTFILNAS